MTRSARSVAVLTADAGWSCWPTDFAMDIEPVLVVPRESDTVTTLIERIERTGALAVVLAADVPDDRAMAVSHLLDETRPEVGVILVRTPSPELWAAAAHAGIRDIVSLDAPPDVLVAAVRVAIERGERVSTSRATEMPAARSGRVIVVLSPKGGSGKTMVASNLAVALAATNTGDVALVDLDCVFGDVASVLGLVPDHTAGQLAALESFDATVLKVFLTRHDPSGLFVLAGSGSPEEGEALTEKMATQIIEMLAEQFAYVVVDTAAGLDERALAAIDRASDCVLLASMDVASIRNLSKEIDALDRLGMVGARRHFILNRADTRVGLEVADVEAAVGMGVDAALPSSRLVPLAMNRGRVVVLEDPESAVARQIVTFAQRFTPGDAEARSTGGRALFGFRRR